MVSKQNKIKKLQASLRECDSKKECRKIRRELRALDVSGGIRSTSYHTKLLRNSPRKVAKIKRLQMPVTEPIGHLITVLQQFHNTPRYYELFGLIVIDQSCRAAAEKPKKDWDGVKRIAHVELNKLIAKYRGKNSRNALAKACGGDLPKSMFRTKTKKK